ncbi:MAG: 4-amino-4-deoxychorismate lyase [Verrucomicrobia bacterium]|nr:MAG: 4-amino-4-deoxychorismate lyase [Verrucomicrobiota bacterium]
MSTYWCNGEWLAARDFPAAPQDRGAQLGLGLFETLLGMDGRMVFCERHLARLAAGCARLGWLPPQQQFADLPEAMARLLQLTGLTAGLARLRLTVTAGSGALADLASGADRLVWMSASPLVEPHASLALGLAPWPRNERGALAGLKCAAYAENLLALDAARRGGFNETVFFNTAGELCEAATGNIFIVRDGVVATPPLASGCLAGITRGVLLELAARDGIACEVMVLQREDLDRADEVFVTSATRGPVAVSRVGERLLGNPRMGRHMRGQWEEQVRRNILG